MTLEMQPDEARRIARDAFVFGFPFAANYRVFISQAVQRTPLLLGKGFNEFAMYRELIPADTPDTPQHDTLYAFAVLDLRREPIVVSVPKVESPNTYALQLGDTSTESLPYISSLTTANEARETVIVGPDYQGVIHADQVDAVITARGQFVVVIGRVSILDLDDLTPLHAIQDGMSIRPLSEVRGVEAPPEPVPVDFIDWDDEHAAGLGVFDYVNMALAWHPPALAEVDDVARFARIGVVPGRPFSTDGMSDDVVAAIEEGIAEARAELERNVEQMTPVVNGWNWSVDDISRFGTDYLTRATVSLKNIYPNAPDHAIYGQAFRDSDGETLLGEHSYEIVFATGELPPVDWFWSLTVYDATTTSMYPNPTGRTSIGDRTSGLLYGDDGSLTITIQHETPTETANWLPAPVGPIYLVLRAYGPTTAVADGSWVPPAVIRTNP